MPATAWLFDPVPDLDPATHRVRVGGRALSAAELPVAELADEREAVVTAEVTRERIDEVREFLPSLANRRTDVL